MSLAGINDDEQVHDTCVITTIVEKKQLILFNTMNSLNSLNKFAIFAHEYKNRIKHDNKELFEGLSETRSVAQTFFEFDLSDDSM